MTFLFMCQLSCADLLNVKIFKVSLFKTVALMDSFKLSAEQIELKVHSHFVSLTTFTCT